MKNGYKVVFGFVLLLVSSAIFALTLVNRVVAIVNQDVITQSQLDHKVLVMKSQMERAKVEIPPENVLKEKVLQQMINQLLQVQVAEKNGVRIDNSELNQHIAEIAKQNGVSVDSMYASVQQDGWSVEDFRQEVREELLVKELQKRQIVAAITLNSQEVDAMMSIVLKDPKTMQQVHLQKIVLQVPNIPTPGQVQAIEKEADDIVKQAKSGVSFAKLATSHSSGVHSLQGGDMGWLELAALPIDLANAVKKMELGEVMGPVRTPTGMVILKLVGRRDKTVGGAFEQSKVAMIYLDKNIPEKEAMSQLQEVHDAVIRGKDFSRYAKRYSKDKSANKGGVVGWLAPEQFGAVVDDELLKLKVGDVSQPIMTTKGYYLFKVLEKRSAVKSDSVEKRKIEEIIFERKVDEGIEQFINTLRGNAYIKVFSL